MTQPIPAIAAHWAEFVQYQRKKLDGETHDSAKILFYSGVAAMLNIIVEIFTTAPDDEHCFKIMDSVSGEVLRFFSEIESEVRND